MTASHHKLISQSSLFDAAWYLSRYPDVAASPWDPVTHYLRVGGLLGRDPSAGFSTRWYLAAYPDVAQAGMNPLVHYLRHGQGEGRRPVPLLAQEWESRLWQGVCETVCLGALRQRLDGENQDESFYAAWALARWYAWQESWAAAGEVLAHVRGLSGAIPAHPGPRLLEVEALIRSHALSKARTCLDDLMADLPEYHDACLAMANLLAADAGHASHGAMDDRRLEWINRPWQRAGLAWVVPRDAGAALSIDNLSATVRTCTSSSVSSMTGDTPLVSVIMPVFNAGERLVTALRSLAEQTHDRLEVWVVDDASTDDSARIAQAFARTDPRFKVLVQPENGGAYPGP